MDFRRPSGRLVIPSSVIAWLVVGAGCPNDTRDAHCSPDAASRDEDPACIYAGNGEGPAGPPACVIPAELDDGTCPKFEDVFAVMNDPAKGNCTSASCHGNRATAEDDIYFAAADPSAVYEELLRIQGSLGEPYIDPVVPGGGWMYCNVLGTEGGGEYPQPPPDGLAATDADTIGRWMYCGAKGPGE